MHYAWLFCSAAGFESLATRQPMAAAIQSMCGLEKKELKIIDQLDNIITDDIDVILRDERKLLKNLFVGRNRSSAVCMVSLGCSV